MLNIQRCLLLGAVLVVGCGRSADPAPDPDEAEQHVIASIKKQGGWVRRDDTSGQRHFVIVLNGTKGTDGLLEELVALKGLHTLSLAHSDVTDVGLKELKQFSELTGLSLAHTRVTEMGLKEVRQLSGLTSLVLTGLPVSEQLVADLKRSLPKCKIVR